MIPNQFIFWSIHICASVASGVEKVPARPSSDPDKSDGRSWGGGRDNR